MKKIAPLLALVLLALCSCKQPNTASKIKLHDNGVNIAYTDTGKGDTTLLFVHGWCINKSYWADQAKFFFKQYRVVAIDLPGYGESGKNRNEWNTIPFSRDVDSVIKQLNLKNVVLIGHSMAGDVVLQSAVDNPNLVKGLVVVDIFKNVGKQQPAPTEKEKRNTLLLWTH